MSASCPQTCFCFAAAQTQSEALACAVLQPLLACDGLVAVQAQLLVKLMKEVPQLQPR
jgi:hypothetical protein